MLLLFVPVAGREEVMGAGMVLAGTFGKARDDDDGGKGAVLEPTAGKYGCLDESR